MPAYTVPPWGGPSAPLVQLTLEWQGQSAQVRGILDSGADQTQIPHATAQAARLRKVSDKRIFDANGNSHLQPVYVANVSFDGVTFSNMPVTATPLTIALVGRDILNQRVVLDGPGLTYTL
jgi:predicted aspartyl protease